MQHVIPHFDGPYDHWNMLIDNFIRSKEFWSLVEIGYAKQEDGAIITEV